MKVKKLIELLQKQDPEARVVVNGYEGGFDDVKKISKVNLRLDVGKDWWDGDHHEMPNRSSGVPAIVLSSSYSITQKGEIRK